MIRSGLRCRRRLIAVVVVVATASQVSLTGAVVGPAAPQLEGGRREAKGREEGKGGGGLSVVAGRSLRRSVAQNTVDGGDTRCRAVVAHS